MWKNNIESNGLHGTEIWEMNNRNKSRIRAMNMDYQRLLQINQVELKMKNVDIRVEMGNGIDIIEIIRGKNVKLVQAPKENFKGQMTNEGVCEWTPPTRKEKK